MDATDTSSTNETYTIIRLKGYSALVQTNTGKEVMSNRNKATANKHQKEEHSGMP